MGYSSCESRLLRVFLILTAFVDPEFSLPQTERSIYGDRRVIISRFVGVFDRSSTNLCPQLFEKTTKNLVAKSHPQGLDVQESGHAFIDQLVLTYIVMEKKRREKMTLTGGTAGKVQSEDSQTQSDES